MLDGGQYSNISPLDSNRCGSVERKRSQVRGLVVDLVVRKLFLLAYSLLTRYAELMGRMSMLTDRSWIFDSFYGGHPCGDRRWSGSGTAVGVDGELSTAGIDPLSLLLAQLAVHCT